MLKKREIQLNNLQKNHYVLKEISEENNQKSLLNTVQYVKLVNE